jgi:peroxiredoxin
MRLGNTQAKYALALWGVVIILALSNGLLLRQNLQLRKLLKKFEPDRLRAGDRLESFSALSIHGEKIAIDFANNAPRRVLLFLSSDCPYCREQFSYWKRVIDRAPVKGFEVVAIAMNSEDKAKLTKYLSSMGCPSNSKTFSVALIAEEVREKYKFSITPTTLIISSDGKADAVWNGVLKSADMETASTMLGL